MQNEPNLVRRRRIANSVLTREYEEKSDWTLSENEPNSKPNKANLHFTAENAEYAETKDIYQQKEAKNGD